MASVNPLTLTPEPGETLTSASVEPENAPDGDLSTPPQPTLEELQAENARLKANASGSAAEWRKERERREALEAQLRTVAPPAQNYQHQPPPPAPHQVPAGPTDEELADQLIQATIDADPKKYAQILSIQSQRQEARANASMMAAFNQALSAVNQQQQFSGYLSRIGVQPGSPLHARTQAIMTELQNDPAYAFAANNKPWLMSIAAERAKSEAATSKGAAHDSLNTSTAAAAASQPGGTGSGAPPGRVKPDTTTVYLTAEEKKASKIYGGSDAANFKKYWDGLPQHVRDARQQARKA